MCRLFGLTAGHARVLAAFWLLDAPDSLVRRTPSCGSRVRIPTARASAGSTSRADRTWRSSRSPPTTTPAFATEAHARHSATFVAHVRKATGTPIAPRNTHPFTLDGRIFAHNGVVGDLPRLERHLGHDMSLVRGDTDSERLFALVTREIRRAEGDVGAGIRAALAWIAAELPVVSANAVLAEPGRLWAWRHPAAHELWVLDRAADGARLDHRSSLGTRVTSDHLADTLSVVVASERLDDGPWQLLEPGDLLAVGTDLRLERAALLPGGS
ncbi:class II glutamine amidotransferase [Mobilicoccus sp.]|uniref:class II glutamine amidotransferase n=1 Tax=Mobilicoccus sp. TaxID=2034349 RepID=UPI00289D47C0|nr:class II glutamine amidotransferase [Mobilicoccus sp.]